MNGEVASTYKLMKDVAQGQYFYQYCAVAGIQPLCPVSTCFLTVYFWRPSSQFLQPLNGATVQSESRKTTVLKLTHEVVHDPVNESGSASTCKMDQGAARHLRV